MKALIQRVREASVSIDAAQFSHINQGLLILLGVGHDDNEKTADLLLQKLLHYRIFADANDKMNLNLQQIDGELLIVSQFTLMADTSKGRRPSFTTAAEPSRAEQLYQYFVNQAKACYHSDRVQTGQFAADMQISLVNDGPVTFMLEV